MSKTTLKLSIEIEQDSKLGTNVRGTFTVTDMLFSDFDNLLDAEYLCKDVKNCIKTLKGFYMLTIRLTDDAEYVTYPKEVTAARFINRFGKIEMAIINVYGNCYDNWTAAKDSHIYENIREIVKNANNRQVAKISARTLQTA